MLVSYIEILNTGINDKMDTQVQIIPFIKHYNNIVAIIQNISLAVFIIIIIIIIIIIVIIIITHTNIANDKSSAYFIHQSKKQTKEIRLTF